ncbi:MAG: DUF4175 family protein [Phycisphaerae bacterium]
MTTLTRSVSTDVPRPIVRTLKKLIRRSRMVVLVRGLCAVAAVATASLLAVMAIDRTVTIFASWPRWALTCSALAVTGLAALWFLIRPLARTFTMAGIARAIEARHPELHERISSAVELLSSTESEDFRGSHVLIEALAREACEDAAAVAPRREVTLRSVRPFFYAVIGLLAVLAGLFAVWPDSTAFLLRRAVAPYMNLANIRAGDMTIRAYVLGSGDITNGDLVIQEGQRMVVEVDVANRSVRGAEFRRATAGPDAVERMTFLTDGDQSVTRFGRTSEPITEGFRYRITAGDAVSEYFTVTVVPAPLVKGIDVAFDYPDYTKKPRALQRDVDGDIRALAGTAVTIMAHTNTAVQSAVLLVNGMPAAKGEVAGVDNASVLTFKTVLAPNLNGRWAIRMVKSANGKEFTGLSAEHKIESVPDAPPTIKIVEPAGLKLKLKPSEHLPIHYAATDDLGLGRLEILVRIDGKDPITLPIALPAAANASQAPCRVAVDSETLDMSKLDLRGASNVSVQLRAFDTLPSDMKGPQQGLSDTIAIQLDVAAQPYAVQMTLSEEVIIRQLLQELQKELQVAKQDSAPLQNAMDKLHKEYAATTKAAVEKGGKASDVEVPELGDAAKKQVDRMRGHLGISAGLVQQISEKVAGGTFASMGEKVAQVEGHVRGADNFAAQLKITETSAGRKDRAERTDYHVYHALRIVNELLGDLHAISDLAQKAEQIEDMSNRENDLVEAKSAMEAAKNPDGSTSQPAGANANANSPKGDNQPPMSDQEWKNKQAAIASQLGQMTKQSPAAVAAQAKKDAEKVKDLAAEARRQAAEEDALAKQTERLAKLKELELEAKKLAAEQAALAAETQANKPTSDQAKPMRQAAEDLKAGKPADALPKQSQAQAGLRDKATPKPPATATQPTAENARAKQLEDKQADITRRTNDLNEKLKALEGQKTDDLARLKAEQTQIAKEAGDLSEKTKQTAPQADELDTKAAMSAKKAADEINADKPQDAAKSADKAADELGQLARRVGNEAGKDLMEDQKSGDKAPENAGDKSPDNEGDKAPDKTGDTKTPDKTGDKSPDKSAAKPDVTAKGSTDQQPTQTARNDEAREKSKLADQAADLARRQKNVADQLKALAEAKPEEMVAAKQKALGDKTAQLKKDADLIKEHSEELLPDPETKQEASKAASEINQAKAGQEAARKHLSAAQPQSALPQEQASAAALNKAADAFERLGKKLADAAAKNAKPDGQQDPEDQTMADAYDQTKDAAATEELKDAALAAKLLGELSKQASEKARAQGAMMPSSDQQMMKMRSMPNSMSRDPRLGAGLMPIDLTPAQLEALGINVSDWARLPGNLRDEVLQAAEEGAPEEYRPLIKQYFQEIAKRGAAQKK